MEADKFFEALFNGKHTARFEWKNLNKQTLYYNVPFSFEHDDTTSMFTIEVTVKDGVHYVRDNAVKLFALKSGIVIQNKED